jgi:translation elongation factor EF-G
MAPGGIEEQTRKLFGVCRLRDVPIITFVNKLDREGRDPFDLLDEIEQSLALDVTPTSWPIGVGRDFLGTYDLFADALLLFERGVHDRVTEPVRCSGLDDRQLPRLLPKRSPRQISRGGRDGEGAVPALRPRGLSRGPSDAGLFRQCAEQFRGARIAARSLVQSCSFVLCGYFPARARPRRR